MCFAAKYVSLFLCNLSSITPYPQCLQIITYQRQNHSFFAYLDNSSLSLQIILLNLHVSTLCWFIIDVTEWIFNRAKSPMWLRGWRHIYIKGVTDALILTCWNFASLFCYLVTIWISIWIWAFCLDEKQHRNKSSRKQHFCIFLVSYCFFGFCLLHFVVLLKILSVYRTVFSP